MGRHCGNLAVSASLASRDVNICVVPEISFQIYGKEGVYESVIDRCKQKGHCIIVIAEGSFNGLVDEDKQAVLKKLSPDSLGPAEADAEFPDLASFMKKDITEYSKRNHNIALQVKYLDPKCSIRACPANAEDRQFSHTLALSSVHSAMAGFTDFAVGQVRTQAVMIPFEALSSV